MIIVGIDPSFTGFAMCDGERNEVVSTSPVPDVLEELSTLERIAHIIEALDDFLHPLRVRLVREKIEIYLEAPMMNTQQNFSIYQMGALYHALHSYGQIENLPMHQTSRHSIMSALFGKKVIAKQEVSGFAHRKFGVLYERDSGLNKLHAYLVYEFGCGVRDGRYGITPAARPGANRRKRIPSK